MSEVLDCDDTFIKNVIKLGNEKSFCSAVFILRYNFLCFKIARASIV